MKNTSEHVKTVNTANFTKAYLTFLDDALKLWTTDCNILIDELLYEMFQAQLKHVEASQRSGKYAVTEAKFIRMNAKFLIHAVLRLAVRRLV